ncbi:MAG: c-type cytochrome [Gammaproteobacteria bacterium]|nr:c-type cytochrome [Gammaproteobacteria bacterium]MDH5692985.1 c-type cytochrome [Gammaproteobacteria bacterium]
MAIRMTILSLVAACVLVACDRGIQTNEDIKLSKEDQASFHQMARNNGCFECHRISATVVGPSWVQIADRYKDAPFQEAKALLVESVKKGSNGKWMTFKGGDGMPPLERRVSDQAINELVEFILNLKR